MIKEAIEIAEEKVSKDNKGGKIIWYVIEIIEFIILVMGSTLMLWAYTPYSMIIKILITVFALFVTIDIFKAFLLTKKMLIMEE